MSDKERREVKCKNRGLYVEETRGEVKEGGRVREIGARWDGLYADG